MDTASPLLLSAPLRFWVHVLTAVAVLLVGLATPAVLVPWMAGRPDASLPRGITAALRWGVPGGAVVAAVGSAGLALSVLGGTGGPPEGLWLALLFVGGGVFCVAFGLVVALILRIRAINPEG